MELKHRLCRGPQRWPNDQPNGGKIKERRARFHNRRKRIRKILKLVGFWHCVRCSTKKGVEFHHIVPIRRGGTNFGANLTLLCGECHAILEGRTNGNGKRQ